MIQAEARTVVADALGKLEALGSPNQIRDYFVQEAITGVSSGTACPVYIYLARQLGRRSRLQFCVCAKKTVVVNTDWEHGIDNPPAVAQFINNFDNRKYPELQQRLR